MRTITHSQHKILFLFLCLVNTLFLFGCATYNVSLQSAKASTQSTSHYEDGVLILTSTLPNSKVRLEIAQSKIGGANITPLALFITAQSTLTQSKTPVIFDMEHITLSYKERIKDQLVERVIMPMSQESLKNDMFDFGAIIEAFHLYLPPKPVPEHYVGVPLIYRGFGGFGVYDYMIISAREQMQRQIKLEEQRTKRAIIIASSLRKNTLLPHAPFKGGFVLYDPRDLKPTQMQLHINIGNEIHHFTLEISK